MPRYDTSTLDERVVEMRIDHDNFEKGAKETISTLEKLEKALKIKGDSSAIDDMSKAVRSFDASPISDNFSVAVDSISSKAAFASRIIQNLADDVYNFGKKTIKELTIDQIGAGMDKYTTLAETTQALMASTKDYYAEKGFTDQTAQLGELEKLLEMIWWYSDETSYEFNQMASTMSKMVSAGVEVEKAAQATVGIATLTAASGADAKAASHTMEYAWSQAFGTGFMSLNDFRTLENFNIATKELKENILEIAVEKHKLSRVAKEGTDEFNDFYSTIVDPSRIDEYGNLLNVTEKEQENAFFNYKNMRESLKDKWLDVEVMEELTNRYGEFSVKMYDIVKASREANKNMTAYEVTEMLQAYRENPDAFDWEEYADEVGVSVDRLKELLVALDNVKWKVSETGFYMGQEYKTWNDVINATKDAVSSQWARTFKYIFGNFLEAKKLWSEVGDLFSNIFVSGLEKQNAVLDEWHRLGGREFLLGVDDIRGGLWNLVDAIGLIVKPITSAFSEVFGLNKPKEFANALFDLTKRFQEWTSEIGFSKEALAGIKEIWTAVFNVVQYTLGIIGKGIALIGKIYTSVLQPIIDFGLRLIGSIIGPANKFFMSLLGIGEELDVFGLIGKAVDTIGDAISNLLSPSKAIKEIFSDIRIAVEDAYNFIKEKFATLGIDLDPIVGSMQSAFAPVKEKILGFLSPITDRITEFKWRMEQLKDNEGLTTLEKVFMSLKATGNTALYLINQQLQALAEKFPPLKKFLSLFEGASLKDILTAVKDAVVEFGQSVITWFGPAKDKISEFIETAKPAFEKLGTAFSTLWTKLKEGTTFKDITDIIVGAFKDFGADVADWFEPIKAVLEEKIDGFIAWLESIKPKLSETWQGIIDFIISLFSGKGAGAESITRSNPLLTQADGPFSWLPETIQNALSGVLKPIENVLTNFQNALAMLPPIDWDGIFDKVMRFAKLAMTFKGLQAFSSVFKGISSLGKGFKEFGKSIKDFAQNKTVSKNLEAITKGIADFFGNGKNSINSLFDAIKDTLKNGFTIKHKNYDSIGTTILKIAGSIAILVGAIYVLTKLEPDKIKESLIVLGEIAGGLVGLAIAFTILNAVGFDATPMLKMAISLGILIGALYVITKFPIEDFYKGIVRIGLLLAELAAFSKFSGSKFEFSAPFIKLAVALWILMAPLKALARMDFGSMLKGLIGLGAVMLEFGALIKSTQGNLNTGGFIKMALAVGILAFTMSRIAKMDWAGILKGVVGLGVVIFEFNNLLRTTAGRGKTSGVLSMAIGIGLLVAAMWAISRMDLGSILKGVITLSVIMKAFGAMIKDIKGLSLGSGIMSLIVIAGLLTGVYFAFKFLNDQNTDFTNVLKFTTAVAEVAISCGYMIKSLAPIPFVAGIQAIGLFLIFLAAVVALTAGLAYLIGKLNPEQLQEAKENFAELSEFANYVGSAFGNLINGFVVGAGLDLPSIGTAMSEFMTNIQGFVEGCKGLKGTDFSGVGKLTGAILELVATDFISAVLSLFTGAASGKSSMAHFQENVAGLARCLNTFASNISGIEDCSGDVDYAVAAAEGLVKVVNALPSTGGIWQAIAGYKDTEGFAEGIESIGRALKRYSWSIKGIEASEGDMDAAGKAAKGLSELENSLPNTGGAWQLIAGFKDLSGFSEGVKRLGNGLRTYSTSINGISDNLKDGDIKAAQKVAKGLTDLQNSLPESGGWIGAIFGEQSLDTFGQQLGALGAGLKEYAVGIFGISSAASEDDIARAKSTGKGLADLQDDLSRIGGVAGFLLGNKNLATFGTQAASFGNSLKMYSDSISGIAGSANEEDLQAALDIAGNIKEFQDTLDPTGGLVQMITGYKDLDTFKTNLENLGAALKSYSENISGISEVDSGAALSVITSIQTFIEGLQKTGGLAGFFTAIGEGITGSKGNTLTDVLTTMVDFSTQFQTFAAGIESAPTALANFNSAAELIRSFKSLQNESGDMTGASIITEADLAAITQVATQIPAALAEGISQNSIAYGNALNAMLNEGYSVFNLADQSMYNIGWNLCAGLANGIIAGSDMPVNAAAQMASAVVDTVNGALEVHSPSRVFYEIGDYLMQGLSQGITQNENGPVSSVTILGDQLIQAIQNSMAQVVAMTNQSFDFQPQITPVIDMSNVRSGAAEYSSLFSGGRFSSMGMYSGISRSIQASQRAQQAYNDMLKSAPQTNAGPNDSIVVNVYAAEGQSEESIADSVINRISAKSSRRSVAFG